MNAIAFLSELRTVYTRLLAESEALRAPVLYTVLLDAESTEVKLGDNFLLREPCWARKAHYTVLTSCTLQA